MTTCSGLNGEHVGAPGPDFPNHMIPHAQPRRLSMWLLVGRAVARPRLKERGVRRVASVRSLFEPNGR